MAAPWLAGCGLWSLTAAAAEPAATAPAGPEGAPEPPAIADALSLDAGATCLEHDRLTEQVVTWLGRDELDPRLTVVVEGDASREHTLRFTLRDRGSVIAERVFERGPTSCEDLHAVVGLAIALAVDATVLESVGIAAATEPEPEPEPPRPTPAPPVSEVHPRPSPTPSPGPDLSPRPRPWTVRLRGGGLVTVGLPPPVGGGAELGVELGWKDILDVQAGVLGASAGAQPISDVETLDITLLAGRVDVCGGPTMGRVRPRFCAGMLAGSAIAEGRGFPEDFRASVPWMAGAFGVDLRVTLVPRLALSFDLDGLVTVWRPVFDVEVEESQVRKLRDLPRLGGTFGVGLVFALGEGRGGARP